MHKINTLKNGLTLITINLPHLDSVTTLVAVGAGSRYETKTLNGISHFLEHMFFKGSRKYPTAEIIATLVDGIGAIQNAGTGKEGTNYWIKSQAKYIELASDIISSMIKESLFSEEEIEKEKGVIVEELRMYRDNPQRYVGVLFERLQFGDQPLGWDVGGEEEIITSFIRDNFISYMDSLYSPSNMVLVFAGKIPQNVTALAEKYFGDLPKRSQHKFKTFKKVSQTKPKVNIFFKKTDQANLILGVEGYDRNNAKKYAATILAVVLGSGMSSRLFIQVREKRGFAYGISADHETYVDTGIFTVFAGLKLEKIFEGLEVIVTELKRTVSEKISEDEIKKAKDMIRGRLSLSKESTNFLAGFFSGQFILDRKIETFEEYLKKIDSVTADDVREVARELFRSEKFNLQIIGPFKNTENFIKILKA